MTDTPGPDYGDVDSVDAYCPGNPPANEQVARRLHELRMFAEIYNRGRVVSRRYDNLSAVARAVAEAVAARFVSAIMNGSEHDGALVLSGATKTLGKSFGWTDQRENEADIDEKISVAALLWLISEGSLVR